MKTSRDPRHIKREKAVKALFTYSFKERQTKNKLAQKIITSLKKIDRVISEAAPERPIKQVNKIDLAILRLAVYEMALKAKEPPKVIIDEAVELAKKFGSDNSPSFINGVLATVYKKIQ